MKKIIIGLAMLAIAATAYAQAVKTGGTIRLATPIAGVGPDGGASFVHVDSNGNMSTAGTVSATTPAVSSANTPGICVSDSDGGSVVLLSANSSRHALYILAPVSNTDVVWVKFGATASVDGGNGIPLSTGWSINDDSSAIYTGEVDFIANSGTQSACAVEF